MYELKNRELGKRSLLLVDIENLCMGPNAGSACAGYVAAQFNDVAGYQPGDLTIIGASHISAPDMFAWPNGAQRIWRSGVNGGELAIIEQVKNIGNFKSFNRVVIGSGDGEFVKLAQSLRAEGLTVHVVANRGSVSRELRMLADEVRYLPVLTSEFELAA